MPELPEVEIVRRGMNPAMKGQKIQNITLNRMNLRGPIPDNFKITLEGQQVSALLRRGKYIIICCANDAAFVLHLGMSGRIYIYTPDEPYNTIKHDHVIFHMDNGTRIAFNDPRRFGMLYLTCAKNWQTKKPFSEMGPEPLSNNFSGTVLFEKLKNKRSPIKTTILDQKIVSGVGNIYACESLYMASIAPQRLANTISLKEADILARAIRDVLSRAIDAGGSSLKDYVHTDGTLGYFQHNFHVYDREGYTCPQCNDDTRPCVERITQAGRSTFYCPHHQK